MAILQGARITGSIIATTFIKASGFSGSLTASNLYVLGKAGIGTTSPGAKLDVVENSAGSATLRLKNISSTGYSGIEFLDPSNNVDLYVGLEANGGGSRYNSLEGGHRFYISSTEKVRINTDGNVGIGTTSPTELLSIRGTDPSVKIDNGTKNYLLQVINSDSRFRIYDNILGVERFTILTGGNVVIGNTGSYAGLTISDITANDGNDSLAFFYRGTSGAHESLIRFYDFRGQLNASFGNNLQDDGSGTQKADLVFKTAFNANPTERMRITNTGNVGIGTSSPAQKLTINNGSSGGSGAVYPIRLSGGTMSSANDATGIQFIQRDTFNDYGGYIRLLNTQGNPFYLNPRIEFGVQNTDTNVFGSVTTKMVITGDGNVGIGTTSPGAKLDVNGDVYVSPNTAGKNTFILSTNASNDARLLMKSDTTTKVDIQANGTSYFNGGNVGIGTTTPFGTNVNRTVLSVNGTTDVSLNIGSGGSQRAYLYGVSSYAELGTIGSLPLRFAPNNSEKMRLDANGNLGIGTTSPSSPLAVQSNANQLRLQTQDAPSTIFAVIGARYDTTHPFTIEVANNNSTAAEFMGVYADGGGIDNRVVFPTGNVGIGTTSPLNKLSVGVGSPSTLGSGDDGLRITDGTRTVLLSRLGSTFSYAGVSGSGSMLYSYDKLNIVADTSNPIVFNTGGSERMRIDSSVGIGVTPTVIFGASGVNGKGLQGDSWTISSLQGTDESYFGNNLYSSAYNVWSNRVNAASGAYYITGGTHIFLRGAAQAAGTITPTESMRITSTGAVGIGLTNPNTKLQVSGSATIGGYNAFYFGTGVNSLNITAPLYPVLAFYYGTNLAGIITGYSDHIGLNTGVGGSKYISFEPGDSEIMRITAAGNVGIGTTSPAAKLDITSATDTFSLINATNTAQGNRAALFMAARNVNGNVGNVSIEAISVNNQQNDMVFRTGATTMGGFGTERMRISGSGTIQLNTLATYVSLTYEPSIIYTRVGQSGIGGIYFGNSYNSNNNVGMQLRVSNDGTQVQAVTINNQGNVGIGTTVPAYKLDVAGSVYGSNYFTLLTAATYGPSDNSAAMQVFGSTGSGGLTNTIKFVTVGSERVRIDSSGNVGIGTTTTTGLLTLNGTYPQLVANNPSTGSGVVIQLKDNGRDAGFMGHSTTTARLQFGSRGSSAAHMTISGDGDVGIGTTAPTNQANYRFLQVNGTNSAVIETMVGGSRIGGFDSAANVLYVGTIGSYPVVFRTAVVEKMRITSDGNVGIGTTSPLKTLQINAVTASIRLEESSAGSKRLELSIDSSAVAKISANQSGQQIAFETVGTERIRIAADGNVGIGTTSPTNKLHISGSSTNLPLKLEGLTSNATGYFLTVDNTTGVVHKSTSGASGTSGTSGANGSPGTSGSNGANGSPGTSGTSGANGSPGTSGSSGANGSPGTSGSSGISSIKAWVHFNGGGTSGTSGISPNASNNVSSITDNGTGDYTINFTTAFANANYVVAGTATYEYENPGQSINNMFIAVPRRPNAQLAGSCRISTPGSDNVLYDCQYVRVLFSN